MVLPPVPEDLVKSHGALGHCANQEFIASQLQTFLSLSTQLVPLKFDHADCISPVPPGQLCQQSALAGGCKAGLEEPCPSATVLSSMWQQAEQCMRRPVNPYSSATSSQFLHLQSSRLLLPLRQVPSGKIFLTAVAAIFTVSHQAPLTTNFFII